MGESAARPGYGPGIARIAFSKWRGVLSRLRGTILAGALGITAGGLALMSGALAQAPDPVCPPQFTQVNEDGFGDPFNLYAWSMKEFGGLLYVGTFNLKHGGDIWRYDGNAWERVATAGFGTPENLGMRNLVIFNGWLYTGTFNEATGAEIWRTLDGVNWTPVMLGGFGFPGLKSVRGMIVFDDTLYVGFQREGTEGGQLWRTSDGLDFEPVTLDGFGDPSNDSVHTLEIFQNQLYAGTRNETGLQVWRSADGVTFEPVVGGGAATAAGFGIPGNFVTYDLHTFGPQLFIGTGNLAKGFTVVRTEDGIVWFRAGLNGFGDRSNVYAWRFHTFEAKLWLGTANLAVGKKAATLWRLSSQQWEQLVGPNGKYFGDGFDDLRNWGIRSFATYQDKLFIGTGQCWFTKCEPFVTGAEIWLWPGEASCPALGQQ